MKVAFHTLGCKVNQVETEQIKEEFLQRGYEIVPFNKKADVYVINTCTVTHISDRKSRAAIRRAVKRNPGALVAVTGCLPQVDPEQVKAIAGVSLITGNNHKEDLVEIIEACMDKDKKETQYMLGPIGKDKKLRTVVYKNRHRRTRAFVKIQDGCESYCSYCIIPYARGPIRSKEPEQVLQEIRSLLKLEYREIVLTGIHSGYYGHGVPGWDLSRLLDEIINRVDGRYRLRLGSIEPLEVNDEIIRLIAGEKRICRHLHIPLQSGSSRILKAMNRRYDRNYYRDLLFKIYNQIPDVALTMDVMVGFPGETDEDFKDTYSLIEEVPAYNLHVFQYSRRSGTPAASMSGQVDERVKHERSHALLQLAEQKQQEFINKIEGRELEVLVERRVDREKTYLGLSDNYLPLLFETDSDITGQFIRLVPGGNARAILAGEDITSTVF